MNTRPVVGGVSRRPNRALRALAIALIIFGALALIDAGITLVWQEPITALIALVRQNHLSGELRQVERTSPTAAEQRALASLRDERRRVEYLAWEMQHHTRDGSPVGRISIPRVDASYVVVRGTGTDELESGPGVYDETHFPGIPGTTAIAGHRTTYLAPFRDINLLARGNHILLDMPYAHFTYTVIGHRVVSPSDVAAAVDDVGYSRLVLSACTPLFSAAQRLLVYARLTRIVPEGAARRLPGGAPARPIVVPVSSRTREAPTSPLRPLGSHAGVIPAS
ncbi:MAG: sortase [Solirubrobacteraceae bacterium]